MLESISSNDFFIYFKGAPPLDDHVVGKIKTWSNLLLVSNLYTSKKHGEDFFLDASFQEIDDREQIICTRWIDPPSKSFYCISGYGLNEYFPWWKRMMEIFESYGLKSWLSFPCILISKSKLSRHADIGRRTALNFPIFGTDSMQGYFFESKEENSKSICKYMYKKDHWILMDTTIVHGGFPTNEKCPEQLRAVLNMGFDANFSECKVILNKMKKEKIHFC